MLKIMLWRNKWINLADLGRLRCSQLDGFEPLGLAIGST
jgi:hypothetical protein